MSKQIKWLRLFSLSFLFLVLATPPAARPEPKTYWHITLLANINGTQAREWLWATMVEMPKDKAYPEEAALARSMGGRLEGTILALVRAAAWRSAYTYYLDTKCNGQKSKTEKSYSESQTDDVYVHGQIITPPAGRANPNFEVEFRWGVCNHRVLMEDGRWLQLSEIPHVFVGPIRVEGREPEEMRGEFGIDGVLYNDQVLRVKRCGKSWIEDFDSVFKHFEHESLVEGFAPGERNMWMQRFWIAHSLKVQCVYSFIRSAEREHPHWKEQRM